MLSTVTACSTSDEPKTVRVTVTQTVTAAPDEGAAPKKDGPLSFRDKTTVKSDDGTSSTAEVLAYTHTEKGPQAPGEELGGDSWATAEIRVCNTGSDRIGVSQDPWSVDYADGTSMETTGLSGGDMPKPEFPMDKSLGSAKCARGKVAFPVHADKRPVSIVYSPEGGEPVEWAVPKA
ncbi:hypothetical protein AT728_28045 [Streptomyces silvensis]|uniref:DUF4352 domain-containing protein n=1 Tax=Streptomyces silvensis TaxID=1765722 RepID=A0A0W7XBX1_9ACTN|nr:hypothetical protein AT728_28045 [Streptomyces silvensis]